jgi:hypothetical protein
VSDTAWEHSRRRRPRHHSSPYPPYQHQAFRSLEASCRAEPLASCSRAWLTVRSFRAVPPAHHVPAIPELLPGMREQEEPYHQPQWQQAPRFNAPLNHWEYARLHQSAGVTRISSMPLARRWPIGLGRPPRAMRDAAGAQVLLKGLHQVPELLMHILTPLLQDFGEA